MSNINDFVIKDGVLGKYTGNDTDVVIPDGVTEISGSAFSGCKTLKSISIPDGVTKIGSGAFRGCASLTSITIPDSVAKIGDHAFSGCTSLTGVTIPDGVKKIEGWTFEGCASLTNITITYSVIKIGKSAFHGCKSLTNVTIPNSVTKIEGYAFDGCTSLTSVTIPDGVKKIEESAFSVCASLTSVTIPDGVKKIGMSAFSYCASLTSITIPDSVTEIEGYAFAGCTSLRIRIGNLSLLAKEDKQKAVLGFLEAIEEYSEEQKTAYVQYTKRNVKNFAELLINNPDALAVVCREKLIPAKNIEEYIEAAQNSGNMVSVAILLDYNANKLTTAEKEKSAKKQEADEETVISRMVDRQNKVGIDGLTFAVSGKIETFENRNELKDFMLSKGAKLSSSLSAKVDYLITNDCDANSEKIQQAKKLGIEIITEKGFNEKANRIFRIENNILVSYLGNGGNVVIYDNVTEIGYNAFKGCKTLKSISIPDGVKKIRMSAFSYCTSLTSITISDSVTEIGYFAFDYCPNLTIYAPAGSYAEKYAKEWNIPFVAE